MTTANLGTAYTRQALGAVNYWKYLNAKTGVEPQTRYRCYLKVRLRKFPPRMHHRTRGPRGSLYRTAGKPYLQACRSARRTQRSAGSGIRIHDRATALGLRRFR